MKHQYIMGFLWAVLFAGPMTFAQITPRTDPSKVPLLLSRLPAKFPCNGAELEKLAQLSKFQNTSIRLTADLTLSGEVMENITPAPGIQNINIRLSNYGNALLNISILNQLDNSKKITGRIIHPKHAEALVIIEENGKYFITKHKMEFFMVE